MNTNRLNLIFIFIKFQFITTVLSNKKIKYIPLKKCKKLNSLLSDLSERVFLKA